MVGGDRRSPPRHPPRSSGGRDSGGSGRERKGIEGGKLGAAVRRGVGGRSGSRDGGRIIMGTDAGNREGSYGKRRLSFGSTGGPVHIGAEGSRLVQDRSFDDVRGARSGASGQGTVASGISDVETVIVEDGSGASELDDVMEVIGGSVAEEFLKEVSTACVDMEQADYNPGIQERSTEELRESNAW
ncbi:uncharacterized protein LOC110100271 [Dendrobium catenatum]|uniref:uncharacterized protein LOC110100271 n=1 Tax=Dendrobium catenatum TaxID=906689 RepID=UPI0009F328A2|nr:uncharacterized protein LOC110100271 [Dendrobium catenatum]